MLRILIPIKTAFPSIYGRRSIVYFSSDSCRLLVVPKKLLSDNPIIRGDFSIGHNLIRAYEICIASIFLYWLCGLWDDLEVEFAANNYVYIQILVWESKIGAAKRLQESCTR